MRSSLLLLLLLAAPRALLATVPCGSACERNSQCATSLCQSGYCVATSDDYCHGVIPGVAPACWCQAGKDCVGGQCYVPEAPAPAPTAQPTVSPLFTRNPTGNPTKNPTNKPLLRETSGACLNGPSWTVVFFLVTLYG